MKALATIDTSTMTKVEFFGDSVIDEFIASRHASENTNRTYKNALRQLLKFFAANNISMPTESDIDSFVNGLKAQKKSAATLRLYTTVTKSFFSFTARKGYFANVAADVRLNLRKTQTHAKRALSNQQAKDLLASVEGENLLACRDRAVIALCLTCGLRTVEISRADRGDLRDDGCGGYYLSVQGKGHVTKDQIVRVAPSVAKLVDEYLSLRGEIADGEPLFVSESNSNRGDRLSVQSVQKMIRRRMKKIGVYSKHSVTPHSCRHFAATTAIKAGVDIREVSQMLRHSNLTVTSVYLHDLSVETRTAEMRVADSLFGGAA
ncbi:MAG: tyrosine-type recombinase/integrase [Selenomonadaceae bacterium]|nr:tyrosine-type recombinase/integrase [Selenomonadaceae bacterium]